jgi:hypothetical protein
MEVEPNRVYVIPPDSTLIIKDRRLQAGLGSVERLYLRLICNEDGLRQSHRTIGAGRGEDCCRDSSCRNAA